MLDSVLIHPILNDLTQFLSIVLRLKVNVAGILEHPDVQGDLPAVLKQVIKMVMEPVTELVHVAADRLGQQDRKLRRE